MGIFIVNVLVLFVVQFLVALVWYSYFFKKLFTLLSAQISVDIESAQKVSSAFIKWNLSSYLVKALFIALIVWIMPESFANYIVLLLFTLAIPSILIGSHIRTGDIATLPLVALEGVHMVISLILMFSLAFFIKGLM